MAKSKKSAGKIGDQEVTRLYTYNARCSFTMEVTLSEWEVEPDPKAGKNALSPRAEVLRKMEKALEEHLRNDATVHSVKIRADYRDLMSMDEDSR